MTDQVIAEVERSMDELAERVGRVGGPASCVLFYSNRRGWVVTAHFLDISADGPSPLGAIQSFEYLLGKRERQQDELAATLGASTQ